MEDVEFWTLVCALMIPLILYMMWEDSVYGDNKIVYYLLRLALVFNCAGVCLGLIQMFLA